MKNFAVMGVAGFIAPRHLDAIYKNGGQIVAAMDPSDSVGILDRYAPDIPFFTKQDKFEDHIKKLKGTPKQVDYLSICSPNHLHFSHVQMGLQQGADVICEKPLVFTSDELDQLKKLEKETKRRVNVILQLRLHDRIVALRNDSEKSGHQEIDLKYVTSRGPWYFESWKGNPKLSGGLPTNIGIHFFDMLAWIWGPMKTVTLDAKTPRKAKGQLKLERANVNWMLSLNLSDVPNSLRSKGQRTYRSIKIDSEEFEFSEGFTELHTQSYHKILQNEGFRVDDVRQATMITETIRGYY